MKNFELFIGCLGNGLTICNKAVMEYGDYKKIAHISNAGNITWHVKPENIPGDALLRIEHEANVAFERFRAWFESRPEILQYEEILDHSPHTVWMDALNDKRPLSEKLPELRMKYYRIA